MSKPAAQAPTKGRDPSNHLADRGEFQSFLERACDESARSGRPFGLILFDIDRLKIVNYGYGQQYGDQVLRNVSRLVRGHLRPEDQLGCWGGQEFICFLPNSDKEAIEALAERLRAAIESMVTVVDGVDLHVTASFATACYPQDEDSANRLLAACGAALHHAKSNGRNRVVPANRLRPELFGAARMLEQSLRDKRLVPAYQPIVDLETGETVAEEAVARIISPSGRPIPAGAFIDAASELQLTYQVDRAIILQTFSHCVASLERQRPSAHFVNISGNLLHHPDVVAEILAAAHHHCCGMALGTVKPLVIEVTERELLEDMSAVKNMLKPFLDFGLRLALDDFGSGYSSYRYLADLPFSFLKVDGELVRRATEPRVRTILQGIQRTASDLGIVTVAELVETEEVADIVRDLGFDWGQGYYFGPPEIMRL